MYNQFFLACLRLLLVLDNVLYRYISSISVRAFKGKHPKLYIIRYSEWFVEKISSEDIVLDVGCHNGDMSELMSQKAKKVLGIEIDEKKIEIAKNKHRKQNLEFIHGDATVTHLNFPITTVTLSNVLEHIKDRHTFLQSLLVNYRPQKILIRVPLISREWVSVLKRDLGINYKLDPTHFVEYEEHQLASELSAAGLEIFSLEIRFGEAFLVCFPEVK